MQKEKDITLAFYRGSIKTKMNKVDQLVTLFRLIAQGSLPIPFLNSEEGVSRELRSVEEIQGGKMIRGIFAKVQHDDLPTAATPGGSERELELRENEGLLDKLHFLYVPQYSVLICQQRASAGTAGQLAKYLSAAFPIQLEHSVVEFLPILQKQAWERIMDDQALLQKIELKIARPMNPDLFPNPDVAWTSGIISTLTEAEGATIQVKISADLRDRNANTLPNRLKSAVRALISSSDIPVEEAKLKVSTEDGMIDLLEDKLKSVKTVELIGRYPVNALMYQALGEAYTEHETEIQRIFSISR